MEHKKMVEQVELEQLVHYQDHQLLMLVVEEVQVQLMVEQVDQEEAEQAEQVEVVLV